MGLTNSSTGVGAVDSGLIIRRQTPNDKVVALAGNPNVGKSTVFNALTGMNQHTGNWPGKTVANAQGYTKTHKNSYVLVDIPGTYSLMAHSAEEEIARNFICFGKEDAVVIVCDATCLERNLNLVLQTLETGKRGVVCVNLMDEAKRKNITVDLKKLEERLGVPVVSTVARKKNSLKSLMDTLDRALERDASAYTVKYNEDIEKAISIIEPKARKFTGPDLSARWLSLKLLDADESLKNEINAYIGKNIFENEALTIAIENAWEYLREKGYDSNRLKDEIVSSIVCESEKIAGEAVKYENKNYNETDRKIDRILTSKRFGYPVMILLLAVVFYITLTGANYPSAWLSNFFFYVEKKLLYALNYFNSPRWLSGMLVTGMFRTLAWVVSVMLPPMAIFFPLFTILEDSGYLPRIAFNLDKPFKKCCACGKQSLTMCMGFGCNAAGIVGCRIIDSPRERLLAILTNNFVPCNGRFPALIAIITMFFAVGAFSSVKAALILTGVILLGIGVTFLATRILSKTVLRGEASSFVLELPPYRRPQFLKVFVRSIFDRTFFVLLRAIKVAAPAGVLIWLLANISVSDASLLSHTCSFLDSFARLFGLDGVILTAFILGFPANEIVIPIMVMAYTSQGCLTEMASISYMRELFVLNGWSTTTAICTLIFFLMHWPCSTTMLTIKKETGSYKWTALAFLMPTLIGLFACFLVNLIMG